MTAKSRHVFLGSLGHPVTSLDFVYPVHHATSDNLYKSA